MKRTLFCATLALAATAAAGDRTIALDAYRDKVYGAWIGQITGATFGFTFEGTVRNVVQLDHYYGNHFSYGPSHVSYALVDDDYYYEMVALYGFERFGVGMTVEQLGEMWKEYRAGTWGSSEQARLALERGIKAPDTGSPRYNRWFHSIGPQFSSDIYGMISPGMVNLAGATARKYSHVNGYAEGSDGAVFVAGCVSEAFFETDPVKIVRQSAQLIDPRSNYRKAIDLVIQRHADGKSWKQVAQESEDRWRPDYPEMNNSVPNGALIALGLLYGGGDYWKTINIITSAGDFTDADCNAANAASVIGAMHGFKAIPAQLVEPLHDRVYGDHMGPLKFGRTIDEKISDLARRVAEIGVKQLLANGAKQQGDTLVIPRQAVKTQALEWFDINDYGSLWNTDWTLTGAARGGGGTTYLEGDVLVTYPRDTRPCRLERTVAIPTGGATLKVELAYMPGRPWRFQAMVDDDPVANQTIGKPDGEGRAPQPQWSSIEVDLSKYAGKTVLLRLHQWRSGSAASACWRSLRIE